MASSESRAALGATGIEVSRLGIGGHTFLSRYGGMDRAAQGEIRRIVETAVAEGITLFDVTWDEERRVFGALVRELGIRQQITLTCWMQRKLTQGAAEVEAEAQRALTLLGLEQVDVLYLDWTATAGQLEALARLRERGLARRIGILGTKTAVAADLAEVDVVLVNHNWYLREKEPAIASLAARSPRLGIISLEPLGRGRFARDGTTPGVDLAAAALKYAIAFTPAHAVLVAVRRLSQLEQNIRIWKGDWRLDASEEKALAAGQGYRMPAPE
jgi:aryl-alcohol dehydrogenase-like predicted oxidoreductase